MKHRVLLPFVILLTAGCAVGPRYQNPMVSVPDAYRGAAAAATPATESLGDQEWSKVFQDGTLQDLIRQALEKNYDIRIAAARILQAEAQVGITRADEYPTIDGGFRASSQRLAASRFTAFQLNEVGMDVAAAWEVDFWKFIESGELVREAI